MSPEIINPNGAEKRRFFVSKKPLPVLSIQEEAFRGKYYVIHIIFSFYASMPHVGDSNTLT